MKLMTEEQEEILCCTWLITEYDKDSDLFFGLCDLGMGYPELGYVALSELEELRFPPLGLPVERDRYFVADRSLREYAELASKQGRIST